MTIPRRASGLRKFRTGRDYARRYIHSENTDYGAFTWDFIREAYRSVADLCIIPIQDYLVKGREARINTPGQADGNWEWRILPHFLPRTRRAVRTAARGKLRE